MARSKSLYQKLRKIDGKAGSVFANDGELIRHGEFHYDGENFYVGKVLIPMSSLRNVNPDFHGSPLVFVDSKYKLNNN
jgi:hypothetical protein